MSEHSERHIIPLKTYFAVFGSLIVLTVLTVTLAQFHFGKMNVLIAILIASAKAALVFLFFMHLKYDHAVNRVILISSLFFVIVLGAFTAGDIWSRLSFWFV